jgi:hypothetical protein
MANKRPRRGCGLHCLFSLTRALTQDGEVHVRLRVGLAVLFRNTHSAQNQDMHIIAGHGGVEGLATCMPG